MTTRAIGILTTRLVGFCAVSLIAATPGCEPVLSVEKLAQTARQLDGKVVCARGVIRPSHIAGLDGAMIQELLPLSEWKRNHVAPEKTAGLIDWSAELGGEPSLYKPESWETLDRFTEQRSAGSRCPIDVTLRAVVAYKKDLSGKIAERVPPELPWLSDALSHHDVELLEIIRVNSVHKCR